MGIANSTREILWTAAALTSLCVASPHLGAAAGTATQDPTFETLTTPDGTRFLLVPDSDPARSPVVHWVHLTPAGPREDPIGLEGLTQAMGRASLNGTIDLGSLNWRREEPLLQRLDDIERQVAALEARGEPRDELLEKAASEVRRELGKVSDPLAWQRAMRRAPAIDVRISETSEASLLVVTTTPAALVRVAGLILARREAAQLRGLRPLFRDARAELAQQAAGMRAAMRREVLALAYLGDVLGRPIRAHPAPFTRSQALDLYRATQYPTRSYHVLTGGFDPEQVARILGKIFVETGIERPEAQRPLVEQGSHQRLSVIPSPSLEALSIGYQVSSSAQPERLAFLAEWLGGGENSFLARRLARDGLTDVEVACQFPFPGNVVPGLMLIEVIEREPSPLDDSKSLSVLVRDILDEAAKAVPTQAELDLAVAEVRGARVLARSDPLDLAYRLAVICGVQGRAPETVLGELEVPTSATLHAREVLVGSNRTVVSRERVR